MRLSFRVPSKSDLQQYKSMIYTNISQYSPEYLMKRGNPHEKDDGLLAKKNSFANKDIFPIKSRTAFTQLIELVFSN